MVEMIWKRGRYATFVANTLNKSIQVSWGWDHVDTISDYSPWQIRRETKSYSTIDACSCFLRCFVSIYLVCWPPSKNHLGIIKVMWVVSILFLHTQLLWPLNQCNFMKFHVATGWLGSYCPQINLLSYDRDERVGGQTFPMWTEIYGATGNTRSSNASRYWFGSPCPSTIRWQVSFAHCKLARSPCYYASLLTTRAGYEKSRLTSKAMMNHLDVKCVTAITFSLQHPLLELVIVPTFHNGTQQWILFSHIHIVWWESRVGT